ncbi:MAG: hypothetical protein M1832_001990 [Thelocarpon impressellum]|nr:MAG: hypothetical protein M1832_001990 [Thelocarpon impressellum]
MSSPKTPPDGQGPSRPGSSRSSLRSQDRPAFAPGNPSGLRTSHRPPPSPEDTRTAWTDGKGADGSGPEPPRIDDEGIHYGGDDHAEPVERVDDSLVERNIDEPAEAAAQEHLLSHEAWDQPPAHPGPCDHGTLSPRPRPRRGGSIRSFFSLDSRVGFGGRYAGSTRDGAPNSGTNAHGVFGDAIGDGILGPDDAAKMSTTAWLAKKHGVTNPRLMYLIYYVPFFQWIAQYRWSFLKGDAVAALTMASFYLPMSLSYASNLAHVPPINGLYSFVFNPIIYAILGSCPRMVVGPEAAGSLLVGSVVRTMVDSGQSSDDDAIAHARTAGVVTGMAGSVIFIAGLTRLGFLDNVLSRPFLRGFISAIGFVILVDQLIPEMGLVDRAKEVGGVSHGSSYEKLEFLVTNAGYGHGLTCAVAFTSFAIIMVLRELKRRLQPRYPAVAYVPDRFLVVVLSAFLTWSRGWDKQGLTILGDVKSSTGSPFPFRWPFQFSHMKHVREAMSTSFLIGLLGFFESSVAAKSLGGGEGNGSGIQGMSLSANRELVALGVANVVGGCFMALPAFGGYGRSKVNASTGGKTPMSSILLSLITIICVLYLLPYFYYLPKAVLSSMISVVAWSLIEEAPHDIMFFWRIGGWSELTLMFLIFAATVLYSLSLGIAIGIGLSVVSVIRHSTRPRIQILGRVPGTNHFENAEDKPEALEFIEGCLIVKIPEPLTFANTGDLKSRLRRLELYGTTTAHPALPRVRSPEHNANIIFDVHGVTGLDGSGAQVLAEIVDSYRDRGVRVFFCRVPSERSRVYKLFESSGIAERCGGPRHFVRSVDEALRLTELESLTEQFRDNPHPEEGPAERGSTL